MVIYYVLKCGVGVSVSFIHYCVALDISVSDVLVLSLGFYSVVPSAALAWGPPPPASHPARQARGEEGGRGHHARAAAYSCRNFGHIEENLCTNPTIIFINASFSYLLL